MKAIINSQESLSRFIGDLRELWRDKKYLTVTIRHGKHRSIPQNSISHVWYQQVSRELREHTPEQIKCLCKYHFGIPILRGDETPVRLEGEMVDIGQIIDRCIEPLPYEDRIEAMRFFPVTRLMNTQQLTEYLEAVQHNYVGRVTLEFPRGEE